MDQRKRKLFKGKLDAKKNEILAAYEKNKNYGIEANGHCHCKHTPIRRDRRERSLAE